MQLKPKLKINPEYSNFWFLKRSNFLCINDMKLKLCQYLDLAKTFSLYKFHVIPEIG